MKTSLIYEKYEKIYAYFCEQNYHEAINIFKYLPKQQKKKFITDFLLDKHKDDINFFKFIEASNYFIRML